MLADLPVYPASMIWPGNLVAVTVLNAMHETDDRRDPSVLGGSMSRYAWFALVTACSFIYYFIPGFLAQCLSVFAVVTWMAPQSPVINQLFGGQTGLSLLPITFDWTQISGYVGSPLIPPWYVTLDSLAHCPSSILVADHPPAPQARHCQHPRRRRLLLLLPLGHSALQRRLVRPVPAHERLEHL